LPCLGPLEAPRRPASRGARAARQLCRRVNTLAAPPPLWPVREAAGDRARSRARSAKVGRRRARSERAGFFGRQLWPLLPCHSASWRRQPSYLPALALRGDPGGPGSIFIDSAPLYI
ncbi:unnamed protein product, partial [Amoebophrya sp. A120]